MFVLNAFILLGQIITQICAPAAHNTQQAAFTSYREENSLLEALTSSTEPDVSSSFWSSRPALFSDVDVPYRVRIKNVELCAHTPARVGYIDFRGRHLFFYYVESQRDPQTDPLIFWFNGGPGCTSANGLFFEHGPCTLRNSTHPEPHQYSWNMNANVVYVDQPVGSGFSYYTSGDPVRNTDDASVDIHDFILLFFKTFSELQGRSFHLMGSSYAAGYIPIFASKLMDTNARLVASGLTPLNLTSIAIGNGIADAVRGVLAWYEIQCTFAAGIPPFQNASTCTQMHESLPLCESMLRESCFNSFDEVKCSVAENFCQSLLVKPFMASGRSPYDVQKDCFALNRTQPCYVPMKSLEDLLNSPDFRERLGVDPGIGYVKGCSPSVLHDFDTSLDSFRRPTHKYVAALLELGIRVLIYAGTSDWRCNWVGNAQFTAALEWHGQKQFVAEEMRKWILDDKVVGMIKGSQGLTFATIRDSGHLVPYEQPAAALYLINHWLSNTPAAI